LAVALQIEPAGCSGDVPNPRLGVYPRSRAGLGGAVPPGARLSGTLLDRADFSCTVLGNADLSNADLSNALLPGAVLPGAHLSHTNLNNALLLGARLSGADLRGAHLIAANLSGADLRGARLTAADLSGANLSHAALHSADLSDATLNTTIFASVNLHSVKGLDSCFHNGPSVIDFPTLAQSWPLPLAFLRGVGLPDNLIDYLPSLLNEPLQFYSCFISHSTKDKDFAERLHADLQNRGVRCWFAPHDIQGGKKLFEQIDQAIRVYDKLLLVLSVNSMNSEWVKTEIANARQREVAEKRQVLFPVRLVDFEHIKNWTYFDADTGKDSAREIREYFIPDFSTWETDHATYQKTFNKLLRDLKAEAEKETTSEG
jgi:uncharacterized protein YjbI with pentapeptide repeats